MRISPVIPGIFPQKEVSAGFTTRLGGVSSAPYDSLNFGHKVGDIPGAVDKNFSILSEFVGTDPSKIALMGQVHSTKVLLAENGGIYESTDAMVSATEGVVLCVKVADCVPLLLYDPFCRAIAAVHCGWRSLTGGITEKTISKMGELFGTEPLNLLAAVGPSIGNCCYEVGEEVSSIMNTAALEKRRTKVFADLKKELQLRLIDSGVAEKNMEINRDCTVCKNLLYFSHRREGPLTGRMLGFIVMKGKP